MLAPVYKGVLEPTTKKVSTELKRADRQLTTANPTKAPGVPPSGQALGGSVETANKAQGFPPQTTNFLRCNFDLFCFIRQGLYKCPVISKA